MGIPLLNLAVYCFKPPFIRITDGGRNGLGRISLENKLDIVPCRPIRSVPPSFVVRYDTDQGRGDKHVAVLRKHSSRDTCATSTTSICRGFVGRQVVKVKVKLGYIIVRSKA